MGTTLSGWAFFVCGGQPCFLSCRNFSPFGFVTLTLVGLSQPTSDMQHAAAALAFVSLIAAISLSGSGIILTRSGSQQHGPTLVIAGSALAVFSWLSILAWLAQAGVAWAMG